MEVSWCREQRTAMKTPHPCNDEHPQEDEQQTIIELEEEDWDEMSAQPANVLHI